jgi:hypothetical protein
MVNEYYGGRVAVTQMKQQTTWIAKELRRTRLPRSSLAEYLRLDNAAVTRLASGERQITTDETLSAGGFFSVVPLAADQEYLGAVESLRSTRRRRTIGLELIRAFGANASRDPVSASFLKLLGSIESGDVVLRADQIVALCRALGFDLLALARGEGVQAGRKAAYAGQASDASQILDAATELWAGDHHGVFQYRFEQGMADQTSAPAGVALRASESFAPEFERCVAYLVADNRAEPMFTMGQTIYFSESEPRTGDYVAVMLEQQSDSKTSAVIGRLLYRSLDSIVIMTAKAKTEIKRSDAEGIRRIEFCRF